MTKLEHFETSQQALERAAYKFQQSLKLLECSRDAADQSFELINRLRTSHFTTRSTDQ
ncbi:hypothetical protein ROLI_040920 [Roseobacter fucihabitans]|uniref:Phasin domain-containing protein n=1 Tax=Roseobacter fucihabitans TaxID=1537242 RepID=A0ABZ2BYV9_9RHOB|nr:hypothetical protein [Roseobacter litoralis]MBC6965869.1 hypothetical protein [Roseobacter litoralis]